MSVRFIHFASFRFIHSRDGDLDRRGEIIGEFDGDVGPLEGVGVVVPLAVVPLEVEDDSSDGVMIVGESVENSTVEGAVVPLEVEEDDCDGVMIVGKSVENSTEPEVSTGDGGDFVVDDDDDTSEGAYFRFAANSCFPAARLDFEEEYRLL